jgi:membrane protein implicated in regulation of membrane protease activity
MITIAAMTMLFLPGTFISAILSTTFFDYDDNGLHVSGKWWVLLAATIPLTVVVFVAWLYWRSVRLREKPKSQTSAISTMSPLSRARKALRWL